MNNKENVKLTVRLTKKGELPSVSDIGKYSIDMCIDKMDPTMWTTVKSKIFLKRWDKVELIGLYLEPLYLKYIRSLIFMYKVNVVVKEVDFASTPLWYKTVLSKYMIDYDSNDTLIILPPTILGLALGYLYEVSEENPRLTIVSPTTNEALKQILNANSWKRVVLYVSGKKVSTFSKMVEGYDDKLIIVNEHSHTTSLDFPYIEPTQLHNIEIKKHDVEIGLTPKADWSDIHIMSDVLDNHRKSLKRNDYHISEHQPLTDKEYNNLELHHFVENKMESTLRAMSYKTMETMYVDTVDSLWDWYKENINLTLKRG